MAEVYVFGPRRAASQGGRVIITVPEPIARKLRGKIVMVKVKVIEE